jgi:hypothetical protein
MPMVQRGERSRRERGISAVEEGSQSSHNIGFRTVRPRVGNLKAAVAESVMMPSESRRRAGVRARHTFGTA